MKGDEVGVCRFENMRDPSTAGDIFELHCEWPLSVILSSPARIEFYQKKPSAELTKEKTDDQSGKPYALFILDTVSILPGKGVFKVTGYYPGNYNTGFRIVSDEGVVEVEPLAWKIHSVIPEGKKGTIQPFPPYGPWREAMPLWHKSLSVLTLLALVVFAVLKIRLFIRRRRKQREVGERLKNKNSFREFVGQLNLLAREIKEKEGKEIVLKLEKYFRLFLENEFFIFALNEKPQQIVRQLTRYYPVVCKECGIFGLFKEMERLSSEKVNNEACEQLLDMARETAIKIYQQRGAV